MIHHVSIEVFHVIKLKANDFVLLKYISLQSVLCEFCTCKIPINEDLCF